jgi:hypothetical protein
MATLVKPNAEVNYSQIVNKKLKTMEVLKSSILPFKTVLTLKNILVLYIPECFYNNCHCASLKKSAAAFMRFMFLH